MKALLFLRLLDIIINTFNAFFVLIVDTGSARTDIRCSGRGKAEKGRAWKPSFGGKSMKLAFPRQIHR